MWQTIAVVALAGAGAAAAASARDTYSATTFTPRGTYRTVVSAPSAAGQVAAAGIAAGGAYTVAQISAQLDATREAQANEIVQTTTVDPEESYAGRIVLNTLPRPNNRWPQDINLVVRFGGHDYPFAFRVTAAR